MRPGEIRAVPGAIALSAGRPRIELRVHNTSQRPIGIGSHTPFHTVNAALDFDRQASRRMRLDVPAGEIVWFAAGEERSVTLVGLAGQEGAAGR